MAKYAGERFDLIQAGGGNVSVKLANDIMLIKSSGVSLSEMSMDRGYSKLSVSEILSVFRTPARSMRHKKNRSASAEKIMNKALVSGPRPSVESFLHAVLGKYVLHVHSIGSIILGGAPDAGGILSNLIGDIVFIPYATPGIDLALRLKKEVDAYVSGKGKMPRLIFLKNHGVIVVGETFEEVVRLTEKTAIKIEEYLNLDLAKFRQPTRLSALLNSIDKSARSVYLSSDAWLNGLLKISPENFFIPPVSPDTAVYCGLGAHEISSFNDKRSLAKYKGRHGMLPKIIICGESLFFVAPNIRKAKEIEEVFKAHLLVVTHSRAVEVLSPGEIKYLCCWKAEKYRQTFSST